MFSGLEYLGAFNNQSNDLERYYESMRAKQGLNANLYQSNSSLRRWADEQQSQAAPISNPEPNPVLLLLE